MSNIVAIVGRPNVGKSTLFNRLTESRKAIVDETSGVTRDRQYGKSDWNGKKFSIIDTGGYVMGGDDEFEIEIRKQVQLAIEEAEKMGQHLQQGIYVGGTGPTYETPAEYKFYHAIGGDAAGMSTIPEVIVARHSGLEIFGMSIITNQSNDLSDTCLNSGDDVVKEANKAAHKMTTLFERVIARL